MRRYPADADSQSLSADEFVVAAELRAYAGRVAPRPSATFVERVMAAAERSPGPDAVPGARPRTAAIAGAASAWLRTAFGQFTGGAVVPLKVRAQAGALLLVVALVLSAGAALAAVGAVKVVQLVTAPQATVVSTQTPGSSGLDSNPAGGSAGQTGRYDATDKPGQAKPSDPGAAASGHPNKSDNPGSSHKPSDPGAAASGHPNGSDNPGSSHKPSANPKPSNAAQPSNKPSK